MKLILFLLGFTGLRLALELTHALATSPTALVWESTLQPVQHQYHVVKTQISRSVAQTYCRVKYADLATISNNNDKMKLKKEMASNNLTSTAWTGLYNDINSWRWSLNDLRDFPPQRWHSRQPDNSGGNQSCGIIDSHGYWYDESCTDTKPVICYSASNSGADRFVGVASPLMTWTEAQTYCRTSHTDLASALIQTDNDLLAQVANQQGSSWIGLFRDTWKWSDGTNTSNVKWGSGEPDNHGGAEDCGAVSGQDFSDELCTDLYYFICRSIPPVREEQIIRLQVKSDQRAIDPALQASILDQVKQKLKENGMLEDTAVTWRVQKDESVFYKKNKNGP